ncbi:acyl-CoA desaturase [Roseibacillus ishigakijimensis]|uniref:Fatty acid desaturase n=1 Tax=Roseibacillus ishigakijimensis TaxID=454146 RepID=A0A934RSR6_9BACT|nr:fatty acid desaturase [Roseibacillus ishigakijimensis]MBK1833826.1 fatty acid desaturase [Roseibacillus ishigakijimensis]
MALNIPFHRVNWVNTLFLLIISLLAVVGAPLYLLAHGIDWVTAALFFFYVVATGMSITLGYHRLFSHLSFKAKWPVRLFTLIFGSCAFENSALNWASDHRRHHKHVDGHDDPYNINNGFLWAHIGWILFKVNPERPLDNVADLRKDKLVMWQYKYDKVIAGVVGLLLPAVIGFFLNGLTGALGGFLIVGALRVFVVQQSTFFINSLCHCVGKRPYSTRCSARDSFLMSLFTFGEGYHNYHHEFQHDYRNGVKPWNFDPTKWAIWTLQKVGLASNLRRVSQTRILLAEMAEARRHTEKRLASLEASGAQICQNTLSAVKEMQEKLTHAYHELEAQAAQRAEASRDTIERWREETRLLMDRLSQLRPLPA